MTEYERVATTRERLEEVMRETGKKQSDLVKETGLNKGTISKYLSGAVEPRHEATHKLATALNVSETWLWGYDVPKGRQDWQKNNDTIADAVVRMRTDEEFLSLVEGLLSADTEKLAAAKVVLNALLK